MIQTGKIRHFPVLLSPSALLKGLLAWLEEETLAAGRVGAGDLALLHHCEEPAEVVRLAQLAHAAQAMATTSVGGPSPVGAHTPGP